MLRSPILLWGCTHSVLWLYAMLLTPGRNPIPNELSSLVIPDGHQSACWVHLKIYSVMATAIDLS